MSALQATLYHLGVALALGLLIGVERGWHTREVKEGERIAGIRTFGLIGLLGGGSALLSVKMGSLVLAAMLVSLAGMLATAYAVNLRRGAQDVGITSLVTGLLTFLVGALAAMGDLIVAAASAVVIVLLLNIKPTLHHWVSVLEEKELLAIIKLLLISVVLLPILPNQGYGPYQALNPFRIWWMVVLIASISFLGYFAVKIAGPRRGTVLTGLFGGLASSTAVTLHLSRLSRGQSSLAQICATGMLLACGTVFPRILLVSGVINPALAKPLLAPLATMSLIIYLPALWYWWKLKNLSTEMPVTLKNPMELTAALGFGLLLAVVILLGRVLLNWFGNIGVLAFSVASGVADVDAITLWLSRMSEAHITIPIAVSGIVIAAATNNLIKGILVAAIGGKEVGLKVGLPLLGSSIGGLMIIWIWHG